MQTTVSAPPELMAVRASIDSARMLEHTQILCAPPFAGRRVGTEGHARASRWLTQQFHQTGWQVSTQKFALTAPVLDLAAPLTLTQLASDGSVLCTWSHRTEFCEHPRSASHPEAVEGDVVHLSEDVSMEGTWVILETVPQGVAFTELAIRLAEQGAVGLLAPLHATADGFLVKRIMAAPQLALPVLSVRTDLLPTLVGTIVRATVPVVSHLPQGVNILARLDGTAPSSAHAPVLIGAHYDGVGDDLGGLRLPGATDNAAAVAVLLELARVLPHLPTPYRPLILAAFDAEEAGAQGSRAVAQMLKGQGQTPHVLNLDGAACQNEAVWVEAGPHAETLVQALDQAGRWLEIPLILGNIASDHRQFTQAGFPAVGLSVGATKLHTPADTTEQVQPEALRVAATLLLATMWRLAWAE